MHGAMVAGSVGMLLALAPRLALACSPTIAPPLQIDAARAAFDTEPPVLAEVRLVELQRGVFNGCVYQSTITLDADAWDDQTPPDALGYRVELLRGTEPQPPYPEPIAYMYLWWVDDGAEPIDVELRVRAVDTAGNESNPIDIRIDDSADDPSESGCSMHPIQRTSVSRSAIFACLAALAAATCRRRR